MYSKPVISRHKTEVLCELCGKTFMQTRWWQVFCSKVCKEKSSAVAKQEVRTLRAEVASLRLQLKEALINAGTHSERSRSFRYDDENQDLD